MSFIEKKLIKYKNRHIKVAFYIEHKMVKKNRHLKCTNKYTVKIATAHISIGGLQKLVVFLATLILLIVTKPDMFDHLSLFSTLLLYDSASVK